VTSSRFNGIAETPIVVCRSLLPSKRDNGLQSAH
jgi:hypothetical protein